MGRLKRSKNRSELRGGYTTGACAAAAARAAVRKLLCCYHFDEIKIQLPNQEWASFPLARLEGESEVLAGVIKDAGDDPDCTHGIEIQCLAKWSDESGIQLKGGQGVAQVTLPGLELEVGEPAINPVPRANIKQMVERELTCHGLEPETGRGLELTIIVPRGEEVAKETINERLGLIGGISILGTRGTVKPYSTSAFSASVRQSIQIATANQLQHVVLTTGSRTENAARELFNGIEEMALIQAGDFIGVGLRGAKRYSVTRVSLVVMIGKLSKLVSGRMMTHVSGHAIDFAHLSQIGQRAGLAAELCQEIAQANTGRHMLELVRTQAQATQFFTLLCQSAWLHAQSYTANKLDIDITLTDFDGTELACFPQDKNLNNR